MITIKIQNLNAILFFIANHYLNPIIYNKKYLKFYLLIFLKLYFLIEKNNKLKEKKPNGATFRPFKRPSYQNIKTTTTPSNFKITSVSRLTKFLLFTNYHYHIQLDLPNWKNL